MGKKQGHVVAVIGLLIALASALADRVGLGEGNNFGSNQTLGIIVGVAILLLGLWISFKSGRTG